MRPTAAWSTSTVGTFSPGKAKAVSTSGFRIRIKVRATCGNTSPAMIPCGLHSRTRLTTCKRGGPSRITHCGRVAA